MKRTIVGTIRNRLRVVIAQKELQDGRKYTYKNIQEITGIATSTLIDWTKGRARLISVETLATLCDFLECTPGDLLEYIPDAPKEESAKTKPKKSK